jgi:hypothetical protein
MPIVRIQPSVSRLEEVARHRSKLSHGIASDRETQFIANPNPTNTHFEVPSYTPRDQRPEGREKLTRGSHGVYTASELCYTQ